MHGEIIRGNFLAQQVPERRLNFCRNGGSIQNGMVAQLVRTRCPTNPGIFITTILLDQFSEENWSKRVAAVPERKESSTGIQARLRKDLLPALWNIEIPPEKAEKIIEKVVRETKTRDIKELTRRIWAVALQNKPEPSQDNQSEEADPEDLRNKADYEAIDKDRKLDGDAW